MIRLALVLIALCMPAWADITVADRGGPRSFDAPPERVVTLNWDITEQVLDLGITPLGAPEIDLYSDWVGEPAIPDGVADVGLRTEPNLERIAALEPDVILAADLAPDQAQRLERIAPTLVFDAWSDDHDNVAAARETFLRLGTLFGRREAAEDRLAKMADRLDRIAERVAALDLPDRATLIRLNDDSTVWIYGANSIPNHTLRRIGLTPGLDLPANRFGVTQRPIEDLARVEDGLLLAIRPHLGGAAAMEGPLWQALPAIRSDRFAEIPRVWSYGGILSVERHAEAILTALEGLGG